ncbi:hypothetical protein PUN28_015263 [Cardiocondyla obscurior]|uniref:Uncharacterized protein n=1 Tax=Cardiocondyla obscurior TaxID=286306 RepID=A0AAW2F3H2_9HYME
MNYGDSLMDGRARRNKQIRNLKQLVRRFFVQYLLATAPSEEVFVTPPHNEERPWSPRPGAPPPSSIHGDPEPLFGYVPPEETPNDHLISSANILNFSN